MAYIEVARNNVSDSLSCTNPRLEYSGSTVRAVMDAYNPNNGVERVYGTPYHTIRGSSNYRARIINEGVGYKTIILEEDYIPPVPSIPSSISVPSIIKGGEQITISWGSSTNTTAYYLERSVNGGAYTVIRSGEVTTSYIDAITKGWNTVAYRVRAYGEGGYSGYRTSSTITVINFPEIFESVGGTFVAFDGAFENVNGVWLEIDSIWENVNGVWVEL